MAGTEKTAVIDAIAIAIREEIVRQYRENERASCPTGAAYYEEHIAPWLIARRVLKVLAGSGVPDEFDSRALRRF